MVTRFRSLAVPLLLVCCLPLNARAAESGAVVYRSEAAFEDVLEGLKAAILERGMYINNVMDLGEMLERTGRDLGRNEAIYTQAKTVEFCSATLSREMTLEDPARLVNCPFIVSVYRLPDQPGVTYVAHREMSDAQIAGSPAMSRIATMLKDIAEAAAAW